LFNNNWEGVSQAVQEAREPLFLVLLYWGSDCSLHNDLSKENCLLELDFKKQEHDVFCLRRLKKPYPESSLHKSLGV